VLGPHTDGEQSDLLFTYPDQCQGFAGTLTSVRGLRVPCPVSGVCRYPAGTLINVGGMQMT